MSKFNPNFVALVVGAGFIGYGVAGELHHATMAAGVTAVVIVALNVALNVIRRAM